MYLSDTQLVAIWSLALAIDARQRDKTAPSPERAIANAASDHTAKAIVEKLQDLEEHGCFTTLQARSELKRWLESQKK